MNKGVGYIGVAVVYFCHDGKGKFIMAKRSENARDEQHKWDIGGGSLELGESVDLTLKREIKEEYSTQVLKSNFLGFREVHRKNKKERTHWIALDFKVQVDPKVVKIGEPHKFDDIAWFTLDNLPTDIHSQLPTFLNLYKNRL